MPHESNLRDIEILRELKRTPGLFKLLLEERTSEFRLQEELRRKFPAALVRAALSLEELRHRAKKKFSRAETMWFDRVGLEQSTAETVARHKAQRFTDRVWDFCSGIGGDAIALAEHGEVIAVDRDPAAGLTAKWNAEVYGVDARLQAVTADVCEMTDRSALVHIDPDRRVRGSRKRSSETIRFGRANRIEEYQPDYEFLCRMIREFRGGAIKLGPACNFLGKFPDTEIELISLSGECKQATVWFGELSCAEPFRATVLPAGESLAGDPLAARCDVKPPGDFLYDPDPAVVRAGLVDLLACRLGLWRLDDAEEYLASNGRIDSPFLRGFKVCDVLPNKARVIRQAYRESTYGQIEIKSRHLPIDIEAVRRKLRLPGDRAGVLVFARVAGSARALMCERLESLND